ncbi:exodeoxyribonuclease VII large subunit [Halothiobacillus sp. DCM-1]|uniref:exodeoxyribonuclease VII large subunit n=1 Tax=Halothiobacillus sp. DCM-1 TaxID=3112558 RepID=UPI00324C8F08
MGSVLSVSSLNELARQVLETGIGRVQVTGEIRGWTRAASGHVYFQLKDDRAEVRCALFRPHAQRLRTQFESGDAVIVHGTVSLYAPRGDFQLIATHLEPAGDGRLAALFEALKKKLAAEGLFDAARKRPLPAWPKHIGVITSAAGAALHDVEVTLLRRLPWLRISLWPVAVQGESAAAELTAAVASVTAGQVDVLLLVRGGGSMSDLWAFNDEALVRAIAACPVPVISGVGHEIDFTLSDFVADVRAATPTAAAELATPITALELRARTDAVLARLHQRFDARFAGLSQRVDELTLRLQRGLRHGLAPAAARRLASAQARLPIALGKRLAPYRQRLAQWERRLLQAHPRQRLAAQRQRQDALRAQLDRAMSRQLAACRQQETRLTMRLDPRHWLSPWQATARRLEESPSRLLRQLLQLVAERRQRVAARAAMLDALSPTRVLERGYSVVQRPDGHIPNAAELAEALDTAAPVTLSLRFADGSVTIDALPPS